MGNYLVNKFVNPLNRTISFIEKIFLIISCFLVLTLMTIICLNVFLRFFFNYSLAWSVEIGGYILLYVTFLVAPWLLRKNEHVNLDLFYNIAPTKLKKIFNFFIIILGAAVSILLTVYGFKITWENYVGDVTLYNVLMVKKYILLMVIPISGFLMILEFIRKFFHELSSNKPVLNHENE